MSNKGRFTVNETPIKGVYLLERKPLADERGTFERLFCAQELAEYGFKESITQINRSVTKKQGMIRGMHLQTSPYEETKLITCTRGKVFDVAVDLRANSESYGVCHGVVLSADQAFSYLIPKGCAHGFQALEDDCELIYLHDQYYQAQSERGINPLDTELGISWPSDNILLSPRDQALPSLQAYTSESTP